MRTPPEEIVLAKMIQSAKARGLKPIKGDFYQNHIDDGRLKGCCARGAWALDEQMCHEGYLDIAQGNDATANHPNDGNVTDWRGYNIGVAFQEAMT